MAESWGGSAGPRGTAHHADRQRDQCAQEDWHHQRPQEPHPWAAKPRPTAPPHPVHAPTLLLRRRLIGPNRRGRLRPQTAPVSPASGHPRRGPAGQHTLAEPHPRRAPPGWHSLLRSARHVPGPCTAHPHGTACVIPQFQHSTGPLVGDPGRDEVEVSAAVHHLGALDGQRVAFPDIRVDLGEVPARTKHHRVRIAGALEGERRGARPRIETHPRDRPGHLDHRAAVKARSDRRAPPPPLPRGRQTWESQGHGHDDHRDTQERSSRSACRSSQKPARHSCRSRHPSPTPLICEASKDRKPGGGPQNRVDPFADPSCFRAEPSHRRHPFPLPLSHHLSVVTGGAVPLPSDGWCGYQRGPNPIRGPIPMWPIPIPGPKPWPGPNPCPVPGPKAGICARCSGVSTSATAIRAASPFSCIWA
jgi:hypothetical protein